MRVLVCGGRDYEDRYLVYSFLSSLKERHKELLIIQGGAIGADTLAKEWAQFAKQPWRTYKADWKTHGKAAGPIRNQRMLDEGRPDLVVAFPGGRGTGDMVRRARATNIKVTEVS